MSRLITATEGELNRLQAKGIIFTSIDMITTNLWFCPSFVIEQGVIDRVHYFYYGALFVVVLHRVGPTSLSPSPCLLCILEQRIKIFPQQRSKGGALELWLHFWVHIFAKTICSVCKNVTKIRILWFYDFLLFAKMCSS